MFEGQISDTLRAKLAGKVRGIGTAIPTTRGKEIDGRSQIGAARQLPTGEENGGIRLVWRNERTTLRQSAIRAPSLNVVEGGKR